MLLYSKLKWFLLRDEFKKVEVILQAKLQNGCFDHKRFPILILYNMHQCLRSQCVPQNFLYIIYNFKRDMLQFRRFEVSSFKFQVLSYSGWYPN